MAKIIHPRAESFSGPQGLLPIGAYADVVRDTSTAKWDRQGGLVKRRRSQRKAWIFVGAYCEDLMVGLAVADAGYLANAFAYFYVPSENLYREQKVIVPFGFGNDFRADIGSDWELRNFSIASIGDTIRASCSGKFQLHLEMGQDPVR